MSEAIVDSAPGARLEDYDYHLPEQAIAQHPAGKRDASRLMVIERASATWRHENVSRLPSLLHAGDLLIFNDVRVRRARLHGKISSGGAVEVLLLGAHEDGSWQCLGRPGKRLRMGQVVAFPESVRGEVIAVDGERRRLVFDVDDVEGYLARCGEIPLPPYIKRPDGPNEEDAERYQTVYADRVGAVAAPTAGLHFSDGLLSALDAAGVRTTRVTLDVGPATFLPVREDSLDDCRLEPEWASLPQAAVDEIAAARSRGGRVIAVGTTTTRALESRAASDAGLTAGRFPADAFIRPGFEFRVIDGLLTNFHLPRSTLLVLVSAFAGRETILRAYADAVAEGYRFYSYGDATLLV